MTIQRWDPFGEVFSLRQAMDRLLEDAFVSPGRSGGAASGIGLPIDLAEHDDEFVLTASLPGVRPEDVQLDVQGNVLTIQGEAREERETPPADQHAKEGNGQQAPQGQAPRYHYRERRYGRFFRQVALPVAVDAEKTQARFEHGVLTVTLPKAAEARQRRIPITAGGQREQLSSGNGTRQEAGSGSR